MDCSAACPACKSTTSRYRHRSSISCARRLPWYQRSQFRHINAWLGKTNVLSFYGSVRRENYGVSRKQSSPRPRLSCTVRFLKITIFAHSSVGHVGRVLTWPIGPSADLSFGTWQTDPCFDTVNTDFRFRYDLALCMFAKIHPRSCAERMRRMGL